MNSKLNASWAAKRLGHVRDLEVWLCDADQYSQQAWP